MAKQKEEIFQNVAGYEPVKDELIKIANWINNAKDYEGKIKLPRGVLFEGEPGNGKSLLAREFIKLFKCPVRIYNDDSKPIIETFNTLFDTSDNPDEMHVIVLDELDSLLTKYTELTRFLKSKMDGVNNSKIFVIATINDTRKLDPAFFRPGRFDRVIHIDCPSIKDSSKILNFYLNKIGQKLSEKEIKYLTTLLFACSCADIEAIVNDAYLRKDMKKITVEDLENSINLLVHKELFVEKEIPEYNAFETAIHEIGHALLVYKYRKYFDLYRISILRGSYYAGRVITLHKEEAPNTLEKDVADIKIMLGGPMACKLIYKEVLQGAENDLMRAKQRLRALVNTQGFINPEYVLRRFQSPDAIRNETDFTSFRNEQIVFRKMRKFRKEVYRYLKKNKDILIKAATELSKKGLLTYKEFVEIIEGDKNEEK